MYLSKHFNYSKILYKANIQIKKYLFTIQHTNIIFKFTFVNIPRQYFPIHQYKYKKGTLHFVFNYNKYII